MKDTKNVMIAALVVAVLFMAVGFAALSTNLSINGTANVSTEWDVEIVGITADRHGTATDADGSPEFSATTATFTSNLAQPGDYIDYTITVKNKGTIEAELDSITKTIGEGGSHITYTIISEPAANSKLASNATATVVIRVLFNDTEFSGSINETRTISVTLNYKQATNA